MLATHAPAPSVVDELVASPARTELILQLDRVRKAFKNQTVLENFSIEIAKGEFLTLLGPSGCGKSTTLNLIAGFIAPDAGEIILRNKPANALPPQRRHLGMVFQSWALFPHMTVFENVAYGLRMKRTPADDTRRRVEDILRLVRLPEAAQKFPSQLSGGMQQRVALARALVTEPDLLLLDEPLSNLDAALRKEMQVELKRIHEQLRVTTLLVTHSQEEALVMSDRIAVMRQGRVEQLSTPWEIYNRPKTRFVCTFLGEANIFEGVVERTGPEETLVRSEGGVALRLGANPGALRAGQPVVLGLRPEHVEISGQVQQVADNAIPAVVTDVIFKGSSITYYLRAGGHELLVLSLPSASRHLHEKGEEVTLLCSKSSFLVLDGESAGG